MTPPLNPNFVSPTGRRVVPRPGESLTSAIFRELDPLYGSGLTDTDRLAIIVDDHAAAGRTIAQLRAESAARLELLHDAYELIDDQETQLEAARSQIQDLTCALLSAQDVAQCTELTKRTVLKKLET